ncbi:hypothetical protein TB2_016549 [Malus domestica]
MDPLPTPNSIPFTSLPLRIASPHHREGTIYNLLHCNFKAAWSRLYWLKEYPNLRMEATRLHGVWMPPGDSS